MKLEIRDTDLEVVREEGLIPGIIYGHEIETTPIKVNYKDFMKTFEQKGLSMSFEATLDGEPHVVFFKEIQKDPMNPNNIVHFDLMRVTATDMMTAAIPVHVKGRDEIDKKGLVLQLLSNTLDFEFPVTKGINHITVDVSALEADDSILASAIDVPEGFILQEDPNKIILNVAHPQIETEDEDDTDATPGDIAVEEAGNTE